MDVWDGIYDNWEDAPEIEGAFGSQQWIGHSVERALALLKSEQDHQGDISINSRCRDYILPVVCSMAQKQGSPLKILDFGGGLASSFLNVHSSINSDSGFEFYVVEGARVCERGRELFSEYGELEFHEELPVVNDGFDIVHAGSSLQYIDDWRGLLASFSAYKPRYLLLADIFAGNIKPFVTLQNYYGHRIRVRFLNLQELIDEMEKLGFRLLYHSLFLAKILGKEDILPMSNFPKERRLEHTCQLLFESLDI